MNARTHDGPGLLTVDEVAARLRTSPEMVRRMLRDGRLAGFRLGGTKAGWRITAESVALFVMTRGQGAR